jgi:hypothetical protein
MLRPRESNVRLEMPGEPKRTDSSIYSNHYVRYDKPEMRPSCKVIRSYEPPKEGVQKESMYRSEFQGEFVLPTPCSFSIVTASSK